MNWFLYDIGLRHERVKPYTQNESAKTMIKRNLKKLNRISDIVKEIRKKNKMKNKMFK